jgi:hypothetical protein
LAEVGTGTDTVRAVTPEGVRQERTALKNEILGVVFLRHWIHWTNWRQRWPMMQNYAASTATALANRLRIDINTQGLTGTQQTNGQTNLGVYSTLSLETQKQI